MLPLAKNSFCLGLTLESHKLIFKGMESLKEI